jgi:hypothetical protein
MAIKYHLDEHIHPGVAVGLRSRGIDTTTTVESELSGEPDIRHLTFALTEQRVLVTHDSDFLELHAAAISHAGIAYCHQDKYPVGILLQMLLLLDACETTQSMMNRVEYL